MAYRSFKLPHFHPVGATFSILLCVADAVPTPLVRKLNDERKSALSQINKNRSEGWEKRLIAEQIKFDKRFDQLLHRYATQSHPFADPKAAQIMVDRLKAFDGDLYDLYSYSVLSNHVHAELDLSIQLPAGYRPGARVDSYVPLDKVVQRIKGGSAFHLNRYFGKTGTTLWPRRYRDRFIRGEKHLRFACRYTRNNPVAAGLVTSTEEHPFTGGMSEEEIAKRQERRIYPNPGEWYDKLREYDNRKPLRLTDF